MARAILLAVVVGGCSFQVLPGSGAVPGDDTATPDGALPDGAVPDGASPDVPPQNFHLRVEAFIDGESHLHLKGTSVWWEHFIYAAPGRWDADGAAPYTIRPIKLDGVDWLPTWPDVPDPENRSCNGCLSSTTQVPVGVPRAPATATWTEVQTRRAQGIVQQPSAANDWELIVLISDYMVGGAADYIVDIDVTLQPP